jgi:hypothetical protein
VSFTPTVVAPAITVGARHCESAARGGERGERIEQVVSDQPRSAPQVGTTFRVRYALDEHEQLASATLPITLSPTQPFRSLSVGDVLGLHR